jgi:hypothetical protein
VVVGLLRFPLTLPLQEVWPRTWPLYDLLAVCTGPIFCPTDYEEQFDEARAMGIEWEDW